MIRKAFRPALAFVDARRGCSSRAYLWATLEGERGDMVRCEVTEVDLYELAEKALEVATTLRRLREEGRS